MSIKRVKSRDNALTFAQEVINKRNLPDYCTGYEATNQGSERGRFLIIVVSRGEQDCRSVHNARWLTEPRATERIGSKPELKRVNKDGYRGGWESA
jgi:hypothetical protein